MQTIPEIEDAMAHWDTTYLSLHEVKAEYERLLAIMGNVDGDEIILLLLIALANKNQIPTPV